MKLINNSLTSVGSIALRKSRSQIFKPSLALTTAVALAVLGASVPITRAQAAEDSMRILKWPRFSSCCPTVCPRIRVRRGDSVRSLCDRRP